MLYYFILFIYSVICFDRFYLYYIITFSYDEYQHLYYFVIVFFRKIIKGYIANAVRVFYPPTGRAEVRSRSFFVHLKYCSTLECPVNPIGLLYTSTINVFRLCHYELLFIQIEFL